MLYYEYFCSHLFAAVRWEQLNVVTFLPWYSTRQQDSIFFCVIYQELPEIKYHLDGKIVMWKGFAALVDSDLQAILIIGILHILQPLLSNAVKEHKCGSTDGMSIVHV